MTFARLSDIVFLAQQGAGGDTAGGAPAGGGPPQLWSMLPFFLIIGVMFFFMYRTQKKQADERKRMLASIKADDTIVTNGGIRGVVSKVTDKAFIVKVADNVKLEIVHGGVATVEKKTEEDGKDEKGK